MPDPRMQEAWFHVVQLTYMPLLFNILAFVAANNLPPPLFWPCHFTRALMCWYCNGCYILRNSPFTPVTVATFAVFKEYRIKRYSSHRIVARLLWYAGYRTTPADDQHRYSYETPPVTHAVRLAPREFVGINFWPPRILLCIQLPVKMTYIRVLGVGVADQAAA